MNGKPGSSGAGAGAGAGAAAGEGATAAGAASDVVAGTEDGVVVVASVAGAGVVVDASAVGTAHGRWIPGCN